MKNGLNRFVMILLVLSLASLSCNALNRRSPQATEAVEGVPPSQSAQETLPTRSPVERPGNNIAMGEEMRSDIGGFAYRVLPGYSVEEAFGVVSMMAPGADPDTGPFFSLVGGEDEAGVTPDSLMAELKNETSNQVSEQKMINVGGVDGLTAAITGMNNGVEVKGRVFLAVPAPARQFLVIGAARADLWTKAQDDLFAALLETISFFEPVPLDDAFNLPGDEEPAPTAQVTGESVPLKFDINAIPTYPGAENITPFEDNILTYSVNAGVLAVRDFYYEELPSQGWQLDVDESGNCIDEMRCMGAYMDYNDPNNTLWQFIQGEAGYLILTITNSSGVLFISIVVEGL